MAARASLDSIHPHPLLSKVLSTVRADAGPASTGGSGFADFDAFVAARTAAADNNDSDGGGSSGGSEGHSAASLSPSFHGSPFPEAGTAADAGAPVDTRAGDAKMGREEGAEPTYSPSDPIWPPSAEDKDNTPPPADNSRNLPPTTPYPSPSTGRRINSASVPATEDTRFALVDGFAPLILPTPVSMPGNGAPGVRVWSGWLEMPGVKHWKADLMSLQVCLAW